MKINCFVFLCISIATNSLAWGQAKEYTKIRRADSLFEQSKWEEAAIAYVEIYNQRSSTINKGEIARKTGEAYYKAGDFDKSERWYKSSSSIYKNSTNWDEYYAVQSELARAIENNGRHDDAIRVSEKIIRWYTDRKDTVGLINEYYNYALYNYYAGNVQKGIKLYNRTIELAEGRDEYTRAMAYNELGNIWAIDLNNEVKALEYYMKSLRLKLKIGVPEKSISISYGNIGISHKNIGNLDSAMYYYNLGLKYAEQSGLPNLRINPLINIANLQKKRGDFEASIGTFNKLIELSDITSTQQKINLYTNLGILYNQIKKYENSLSYLNLAEELTETAGNLVDKADVQTQKIIAYRALNDYNKAFSAQEKLMQLKDSIHKRERKEELADLLFKYETAEKNKTISDQNLVISQKESDLAKRNSWIIAITMFCLFAISTTVWIAYRKRIRLRMEEEQKVNRAIFESEQKERIRIARDLHDSIGQKLSGIKMLLSKSQEENEDLKKISIYLDETAIEVRNISHNLVPEILNFGFIKALENLMEQLSESKKIEALLNVNSQVNDLVLPRQTEVSLYRIVQEILSNIMRHSQTDKIFVNVMATDGFLQILIEDKGVGFDTRLLANSEGLGWKNILARIKLVNGQINIKSHTDRGSEFLINIPVV